jgi:integrase
MSKAKRLTDISVKNAKPGKKLWAVEVPDGGNGLYLVLWPSGKKTWAARFRVDGRPAKFTLGKYPDMSLAAARKAAIDAREQAAKGEDPNKKKREAKVAAMESAADTVAAVCANYMTRVGNKMRSADAMESILRRLIYPALGDKPIADVRRSHINDMLDHIEDNSGPRMANVALGLLRRICGWHAVRDDNFLSPIIKGMDRSTNGARSRVLNDDELRKLWKATDADDVFSALIRFLLLTACRRTEASAMKHSEVDADGIWTLPARRSKTGEEVERPLSKTALAIIEARPRVDGCDFVFTTTGVAAFNDFSMSTTKLRKRSGTNGWTLHDLRRTARSLMARAGVVDRHAEHVLGHKTGGVEGVYNRHRYIEEMKFAVEALATQIDRIVNPPEGTVVDLQGKRAARR